MAETRTTAKIVFATSDMHGNPVHMSEKTWGHIEKRHPEMAGFQEAVKDAVNDPDGSRDSTLSASCQFYEAFGTGPTSTGVRVLVGYDDISYEAGTTRGWVVTAYPPDPLIPSNVGPLKAR